MHPRLLPIALFLAGGVWGGCSKDQPSDQRSPAHSAAARTVQPSADAGAAKSTSDGAQSALPETVASHPPSAPSTPNAVNLAPPRDTGGGLARNTPYAALFEAGRTWRYRTTFEETAYYSLPGSGDISSKRHTRRVDVLECSVPRVIHFPQAVVSEVTCTELEEGETSVTQNPPAKPGEELTAPLMFSRPPRVVGIYVLSDKGLSHFERLETFPTDPELLPAQKHVDFPLAPIASRPSEADEAEETGSMRAIQKDSGAWCFEEGSEGCFDQFSRICFDPVRGITEAHDEVGGGGGLTTLRYAQVQSD